jgi:hypothetical protein
MSTPDTLNFISQQIHIYFGLSILILGVIGGILNIIIFTTLKTFRETTCAFYLTAVSIVNIGELLTALLIRVLSEGFNIDIKKIPWVCKMQIYIVVWCALFSMTVMCLATIDQYISMSTYRHYSNKRVAQRAIILICIFLGLYCICFPIYYDAPFGKCTIINPRFAIYMTHFQFPVLLGFLPLTTMTTFSVLAFYSARTLISRQINIVRLSRDRQLTAMTLFHAVFVVITTLPYIIFYIYSLNQTSKDPEQIARNNLIYTITVLIDYSSSAVSILVFFTIKERKCCLFIKF